MQFFQTAYQLLCIPYYLIKEKIGIISLKKAQKIDLNLLVEKLTNNNNINAILNFRKAEDSTDVTIGEVHIGHATEPGQFYIMQKGSEDYIYETLWGSTKFQETINTTLLIVKLNEMEIETMPFIEGSELYLNLFSVANAALRYYLGLATMCFGFQFMQKFHNNRHPATCAFWIPKKK